MTVIIVSIIVAWIVFCVVVVWFAFANSSQINRDQKRFELGGRWTKEELDAAEAGAKELKKRIWGEQDD